MLIQTKDLKYPGNASCPLNTDEGSIHPKQPLHLPHGEPFPIYPAHSLWPRLFNPVIKTSVFILTKDLKYPGNASCPLNTDEGSIHPKQPLHLPHGEPFSIHPAHSLWPRLCNPVIKTSVLIQTKDLKYPGNAYCPLNTDEGSIHPKQPLHLPHGEPFPIHPPHSL